MSTGKQGIRSYPDELILGFISFAYLYRENRMMLKASRISMVLSYSVSVITCVFGLVILSGFAFQYVPGKLRIMFGVVLMLWGIYRFVSTRVRERQQKNEEE